MPYHDEPPPKALYHSDGTGRDTYIRRDPVEQRGKHPDASEQRQITRFGAAGSALTRDRHSGHAGFHPGERDNSVGGPNGVPERPKRFLRKPSDTFPIAINHYSTMKEITLDAFSKAPANGAKATAKTQISGFSGFIPRCPIAADPDASKWTSLVIDREAMLRQMFAAMDLNSDGMVSKEELSKLCKAALVDPEAPMVQAAFQTADFSGQGGGGDGSLSVDEIIIFNLEQTAALSDEQFDQYIRASLELMAQVKADAAAPA